MFGFSFEQLLVVATVCILVLGPQKSLKLAYFLGRKLQSIKKIWDECRRQIEMPKTSKVRSNLSNSLQEIAKSSNELFDELKNSIREHPVKAMTEQQLIVADTATADKYKEDPMQKRKETASAQFLSLTTNQVLDQGSTSNLLKTVSHQDAPLEGGLQMQQLLEHIAYLDRELENLKGLIGDKNETLPK